MIHRVALHAAIVFVLAAASTTSFAQVNRCKGPNGQTIYSDKPCEDGSRGQSVSVHANTVDGEYDRRDADRNAVIAKRDAVNTEVNRMMQSPPPQCKFQYFTVGDKRGKELSDLAKRECLENLIKEREGQPPKDRYFRLWQDHHNRTSNERQQAMTRSTIIQNQAQSIQRNMTPPSYKCRPDGIGGVNCNAN
ncbi:DUF4124 domain-containing protein [Delftia acidovorans]|uniref:DUF4124 domain-containing protein n=1 Tax=Delftia acidovorans TaxID=80866 RepID=UPI00286ED543|nr:DUF4124 domain-containing protein [Delftia acidovorans]